MKKKAGKIKSTLLSIFMGVSSLGAGSAFLAPEASANPFAVTTQSEYSISGLQRDRAQHGADQLAINGASMGAAESAIMATQRLSMPERLNSYGQQVGDATRILDIIRGGNIYRNPITGRTGRIFNIPSEITRTVNDIRRIAGEVERIEENMIRAQYNEARDTRERFNVALSRAQGRINTSNVIMPQSVRDMGTQLSLNNVIVPGNNSIDVNVFSERVYRVQLTPQAQRGLNSPYALIVEDQNGGAQFVYGSENIRAVEQQAYGSFVRNYNNLANLRQQFAANPGRWDTGTAVDEILRQTLPGVRGVVRDIQRNSQYKR